MGSKTAIFQVAVIAFGAILSGCGAGGGGRVTLLPTPTPQPPAASIIAPTPGSIYLGAVVNVSQGGIAALELTIGRTLALDVHTYKWTANFPGNNESADLLAGRVPVEMWSCGPSDAQIVAGDADLLIQTRATTVLQYGHPVFISYFPDANVPASTAVRQACLDPATDPGQTFSPVEYIAAWQHIRAIFAATGVTNAVWLWATNSAGSNPLPYYPGSSQVDWVAMNAYDATDVTFAQTFATMYATLAPLNKPMMVSGTGANALNQAPFFQGAPQVLQSQFPQIEGFVYNDTNDSGPYTLTMAGLTAFEGFASDPYMSAMPP